MIAVGRIEPVDGVGQPEIRGHFTFHESRDVQLSQRFQVIGNI
jgi:hypothetical protein